MTSIAKLESMWFIGLLLLVLWPQSVDALRVFLEPESAEVTAGDTVSVMVAVDTEGENINAIEGTLGFDAGSMVLVEVNDGGSVVTLWVERPVVSATSGTVPFSGLIPGGFDGVIDSFSGEKKPGTVFRIHFKPKVAGDTVVAVSEFTALRNDGSGTELLASDTHAALTVLPRKEAGTDSADADEGRANDLTPPRIQDARVVEDSLLYDGQKTLVFRGKDTESGISHFEVREGAGSWVIATSPYVLREQHSQKPVELKAVDNAGNVQIAIVALEQGGLSATARAVLAGVMVGALVVGAGVWFVRRRTHQRITRREDAFPS